MSNATRTNVTKTVVMFDGLITDNEFQKAGTLTAQLRQEIKTESFYPAKKTENEFNGGLFDTEEFGFAEQSFDSTENRVAWILVPENATEDMVKANLAKAVAAGACIYRVLSNAPILSNDQLYSINAGLKTKDDYADSQVMRYPDNDTTRANGTTGKLILQNDKTVQYRKTYFWPTPKEDIDLRGVPGHEEYRSVKIEAELTGAATFAGQQVS